MENPPFLKPFKLYVLSSASQRDTFCFRFCFATAFLAGRPPCLRISKNILNHYPSTRKWNQCFFPSFLTLKSEIIPESMFINWKTFLLVTMLHSKNPKGKQKSDLLCLLKNKNSQGCLIKKIWKFFHFLSRSKTKRSKGSKSHHEFVETTSKQSKPSFREREFPESNPQLELRMLFES